MENTVESLIRTPVESNLLKYSAGQAIFCPNCSVIMDWRKTVVATVHVKPENGEEKCIRSYVVCVKCWDKRSHIVREGLEKAKANLAAKGSKSEAWLETIDGREERFNDFD